MTTTPLAELLTDHTRRMEARAATIDARRVLAMLLALLTFPFFLVGIAAAVVWTVLRWSIAGVLGGFELGQQTIDQLRRISQGNSQSQQSRGR